MVCAAYTGQYDVDWVLCLPPGGLPEGTTGLHGHPEGTTRHAFFGEEERVHGWHVNSAIRKKHTPLDLCQALHRRLQSHVCTVCLACRCEQDYQAEDPPKEVHLFLACCLYYMQMYDEAEKVRALMHGHHKWLHHIGHCMEISSYHIQPL